MPSVSRAACSRLSTSVHLVSLSLPPLAISFGRTSFGALMKVV
jgi:hypothetical protein